MITELVLIRIYTQNSTNSCIKANKCSTIIIDVRHNIILSNNEEPGIRWLSCSFEWSKFDRSIYRFPYVYICFMSSFLHFLNGSVERTRQDKWMEIYKYFTKTFGFGGRNHARSVGVHFYLKIYPFISL